MYLHIDKGYNNGTIQRIYKPSDRRTVGSARYRKQNGTASCILRSEHIPLHPDIIFRVDGPVAVHVRIRLLVLRQVGAPEHVPFDEQVVHGIDASVPVDVPLFPGRLLLLHKNPSELVGNVLARNIE